MDLACLDGVGPIVHHHIVIVADVRQAATHKQNSCFCNKHGLTQSSFQAFATDMVLQSQAFSTNMVLHSQASKLLQQI